jgi:hypothetical protein
MSWLLIQLLWFGLAASVILVDANLMKGTVDPGTVDLETVDLKDRGVGSLLVIMVLLGGLVIPFYMWYSRRTAAAVGVGIALMLGCGFVVALAASALG